MIQNRCDRCGRPLKGPNAKYGWRCAEIIGAGGSLTIDLSETLSMLEKHADLSFESQSELIEIHKIFDKMLAFASAPFSMPAERGYVEKGAALIYAMFSNYEKLGSEAKKFAVMYFIEEMHKVDETLPQPRPKQTFSAGINNGFMNYEAEDSDTNDMVEDSIDAFFGKIPLYNYLNAIFAPTEEERRHSLARGVEGSLTTIENLPYSSSMMGDIAVVKPYGAFGSQPYATQYGDAGGNTWGTSEDLINSATKPGKGGVSPVGRAFQKHAGNPNRAGSFVGKVSGNASKNTQQGVNYLNNILSNPNSTYNVNKTTVFGDVLDVRLPDGTGARWSADGKTFIGFLEKYSNK